MEISDIKVRRNGKAGAEFIQNTIRFPPAIYERLREEAEVSGRSLHGEVLHRISASFGEEFALKQDEGNSTLETMAADIKALREIAEKFAGVPSWRLSTPPRQSAGAIIEAPLE